MASLALARLLVIAGVVTLILSWIVGYEGEAWLDERDHWGFGHYALIMGALWLLAGLILLAASKAFAAGAERRKHLMTPHYQPDSGEK